MGKKRWRWNVWAFLVGELVIAGCQGNKCRTQKVYQGDPVSAGTVTYGVPPISQTIVCAGPAQSGVSCMQTPDSCTSLAFESEGCAALILEVTIIQFQNGQVVVLPSPDVTVGAFLDDLYVTLPYDAGYGREDLTLVSGAVSATVSLNNFDARFNPRDRLSGKGERVQRLGACRSCALKPISSEANSGVNLTFTRPNGDSLVIQNGRAALLNASWKNETSCQ